MIRAAHTKKIFVMAGTNDIFHISIADFENRYNQLLDMMSDSIPDAKIYLQSILPMNKGMKSDAPTDEKICQANKSIQKIAGNRGFNYIDVYSAYVKNGELPAVLTKDGVHLYREFYDRWAKKIEPYVME